MKKRKDKRRFLFCLLAPLSLPVSTANSETTEQCLLRFALKGDADMTLSELRSACSSRQNESNDVVITHQTMRADPSSPMDRRITGEKAATGNRFVITPHKPNYILPVSYVSSTNTQPYQPFNARVPDLDNTEVKFQLSLKAPVREGVFNGNGTLYAAYTNTSWWQAYNSAESAPFRETNHEPELFMMFPTEYPLLGMDLKAVGFGFSHQSNGRSNYLSRSWNRIYMSFLLEKEQFYAGFKPWYRIPEDKKKDDNPNSKGDDNPDISQYMGYGELYFGYKFDRHNITAMMRNNLRSNNKGAVQLDWSFPLTERFRGYVQYFNGYGESLIDYNISSNRLSVGIMLTDWL
ncbi:phospholipase [Endozoicomonas montiporae]|uniref:Phospholipase A1 n=2 Tax=Endozoicomonas montiporae TaxID=1027273 RepID=A0A081NBX6_9GAMM|nr:phospholipase A [Endozoicomonas montiporae]AMO56265.1 phospholipase A [Endozoicomonas montiporae CL-33]KEQ15949.1 phospholipase [Endozoicomonas montiporae]